MSAIAYTHHSIQDLICLAYRQIHHAAQHPVDLDDAQAQAVYARIMLDLRIGAAFTRLQTLTLQGQVPQLEGSMISFGEVLLVDLDFHRTHCSQ